MSGQFDLEVDTQWIRRAAATLDEAGSRFRSASTPSGSPVLGQNSLGDSAEATSLVGLINLRCGQAHDAAAQLSSISTGLGNQLALAADQFDRVETAVRSPAR